MNPIKGGCKRGNFGWILQAASSQDGDGQRTLQLKKSRSHRAEDCPDHGDQPVCPATCGFKSHFSHQLGSDPKDKDKDKDKEQRQRRRTDAFLSASTQVLCDLTIHVEKKAHQTYRDPCLRRPTSSSCCNTSFIIRPEVKDVGQNLIHAKVGDDVILPCHLEPPLDVNSFTIVWGFQGQIIHLYRRGAKDDKSSVPKYQDRTFMFHDEFKNGNISLKLIKVTKEDEGIYTCFVPKLQPQVRKVNVILKLDKNGAQDNLNVPGEPHPGVIGSFVVVLVGALIIIIIIYVLRLHRGKQNQRGNGNQGDEEEEISLQERRNQSV